MHISIRQIPSSWNNCRVGSYNDIFNSKKKPSLFCRFVPKGLLYSRPRAPALKRESNFIFHAESSESESADFDFSVKAACAWIDYCAS